MSAPSRMLRHAHLLTPALVAVAAIVGRLTALRSWWCLDDWGLLGRAAGLLPHPSGLPARWLSQQAWWSLTWPVLGAGAAAHAWTRLGLHGMAAVAVVLIARRSGLSLLAQLVAGLAFAATPVAFTPLMWASGAQELLAGALALWAVERWLRGGVAAICWAGVFGAASILAKESALGLPLFLVAALTTARSPASGARTAGWLVCLGLAAVAVSESSLILHHFARGPRDPYATGGALVALGNLGKFGWWLPTPGPVFTAQVTWGRAAVGLGVLALWGAYGAWSWRRGRRLPIAAWICALLSVAPALPLVNQARPYLGYLAAAAGCLTVASLLPTHWRAGPFACAALVVAAVAWGQWTMRGRCDVLGGDGYPADPTLRAMRLSREAATALSAALPARFDREGRALAIFQPRLSGGVSDQPVGTPRFVALAGPVGASLASGCRDRATWGPSLLAVPADAFVVCERGGGFQAWGSMHDALIYATVLHLGSGEFALAAAQLERILALDPDAELAVPRSNVIGVNVLDLQPGLFSFHSWLDDEARAGRLSADLALRLRNFPSAPTSGD